MKTIILFVIMMLLAVGTVSAFEFDNVGTYYPDTKTMEIKNCFGFPLCDDPIANVTLLSPLDLNVIAGEERLVAWYQIENFDTYDGNEVFGIIETLDLKRGNSPIQKNIVFKKQNIDMVEVTDFEQVCSDQEFGGRTINVCDPVVNGTKTIEKIEWASFNTNSDWLAGTEVIGLFTEVEPGEKVEWIPTMFGLHEEFEVWAVWTESLSKDLMVFYQLNSTSGTVALDAVKSGVNMDGTLVDKENEDWITNGKTAGALNFSRVGDGKEAVVSANPINITGAHNRTIVAWVNMTACSGQNTVTSWGVAVLYQKETFSVQPACTLRWDSFGTDEQSTASIPLGNWTMIAYTVETAATSTFRFYINGTDAGGGGTNSPATSEGKLHIGNSSVDASWEFGGAIDEVGIWNRTLSAAEIASLYDVSPYTFENQFVFPPSVTLNNPPDANITKHPVTFNCSATDDVGVANLTLYINGSSDTTVTGSDVSLGLETIKAMGDGEYNWTCRADDTESPSNSVFGSNFTLSVDNSTPVITSTWNINTDILTVDTKINQTWNFTVTDPHLETCWWNSSDDATQNLVGCNATIINSSFSTAGTKMIWYAANDTLGNLIVNNQSFVYTVANWTQQTNKNTVTEGESVKYNLTVNIDSIPSTTVTLWFNNSNYSSTSIDSSTNQNNFTRTLTIPSDAGNTTGINQTWFWEIKLTGLGSLNTSMENQTVLSIEGDNCTANDLLLYNFTIKDEKLQNFLGGGAFNTTSDVDVQIYTFDRSFLHQSFSFEANETNPIQICFSDNSSTLSVDVQIQYEAEGYAREFYNIRNSTITLSDFPTNINLFDLDSGSSTPFTITYKDSSFLPVPNALLQIQRKYIDEGTFKTVEIPKSDSSGDTLAHLEVDDVIYTFIVTKDGTVLDTFSEVIAVCQNPSLNDCEINLNSFSASVDSEDFTQQNDFSFTLDYNKTSRVVTTVFSVPSSTVGTVELNATMYDALGNTTACSDLLVTASGTLTCTIPKNLGNGTASIVLRKDGVIVAQGIVDLTQDSKALYGGSFVFLGVFLALTLVGIGISSNPIAIGFFLLIGAILNVTLNLINSTGIVGAGATVLWLFIAIILVIIKGANRQ